MKRKKPTREKPKTKAEEKREIANRKDEEQCKIANRLIPQLPSHIVMDILSRLSIKQRLICKCLSDPHFSNIHLLLKTFHGRRGYYSKKISSVDLQNHLGSANLNVKFEFFPKINILNKLSLRLVNSCNGLLCLRSDLRRDRAYVCNPISGEYLALPTSIGVVDANFGLGFCGVTNEYKVLRCYKRLYTLESIRLCFYEDADIYTLGTNDWREIRVAPKYKSYSASFNTSFNTLLNGSLHWVDRDNCSPDLICCFNFGTEQFNEIPPPAQFGQDQKQKNLDNLSIGVLKGCLYICLAVPCVLDMWVMKDYSVKESWTRLFTIIDLERPMFLGDNYQPILIEKNGEILMLYNGNALVSYDPVLEKFTDIKVCGIKFKFHAIAYTPSFISLADVANGQLVKVL